MITFERSFDYALIRTIVTHPRIWPFISDDGSPPVEQYRPIESEAVWYVVARDGAEILGLWMLHPHNAVCWEIHTCLLPGAWGDRALEAARLFPEWIWANTVCRRVVTNVPDYNRVALKFAWRSGMLEYGVNPASFLKNGKLYDQVCLGISPQTRDVAQGAIAGAELEETCQ